MGKTKVLYLNLLTKVKTEKRFRRVIKLNFFLNLKK